MHIGIAGGGLLGRLLAWQLLQAGHRVTVVDANPVQQPGGACRVAAAMLAPWSEAVQGERVVFEHGYAGMALWRDWLAQLQAETGIAIDFRAGGSVAVAHAADRSELQRLQQDLGHKLGAQAAALRWLDAAGLQAAEPALAGRFGHALWLPDEGCLDNETLLDALAQAIAQRGGQWQVAQVGAVRPHALVTAGGPLAFDSVIDARGFGGRVDWPGLRGVRGEVLWVHAPEVALTHCVRLMHPRYCLYIAPRPQQRYVIGATEIESEQETPVTVRSSLELLSALYSVHSGFAEAAIEHAFARCRPALADNLPAIRHAAGMLAVNGLYRHGYLLAPRVVQQALACLHGEAGPWPACVVDERQQEQRA